MKHDEVPRTFHSPYMQKVADKLNILKMTPDEREAYAYYMKQVYTDRDQLKTAEVRGREEEKTEMVKIMLSEGASLEFIQKVTRLELGTIQAIKEKETSVSGN